MRANIHNAKVCTVNNEDCWLAVIYRGESKHFTTRDLSPEFATPEECVDWCRRELRLRGAPLAPITFD